MNREQALSLMSQYCELPGIGDIGLTGMARRFPADGSTHKAMRWLGYMQGYLVARGRFTVEEVKEHSRVKTVEVLSASPGEQLALWREGFESQAEDRVEEDWIVSAGFEDGLFVLRALLPVRPPRRIVRPCENLAEGAELLLQAMRRTEEDL